MNDGIQFLRAARGHQVVTFAEIADHLYDYVERREVDGAVVDRLARFLAAVEGVPHDHDAHPLRGLSQMAMAGEDW